MIPDSKDPFGFNDLFKQIGDALNEGVEQAKRASECKMRRFYRVHRSHKEQITANGVVFPDGTTILQYLPSGSLNIYKSLEQAVSAECIQWIDAEKLQ